VLGQHWQAIAKPPRGALPGDYLGAWQPSGAWSTLASKRQASAQCVAGRLLKRASVAIPGFLQNKNEQEKEGNKIL
jgi:hypothetical protein